MSVQIIAAVIIIFILLAVLITGIVIFIRRRRFTPTPDKTAQMNALNQDLHESGFAYSLQDDCFYSLQDPWQREFGYCRLYDEAMPLINLIVDCEPIYFDYAGRHWLIELWKGQYGMTTGAEIGVYNTADGMVNTPAFTGRFYNSVSDAERLQMEFVLRKNKKVLLRRKDLHWWMTGFKLAEFSSTASLRMDIKITFTTKEMCRAFTSGLLAAGYSKREYFAHGKSVFIVYTTPHTRQPDSRTRVQETLSQQFNENNCRMYAFMTAGYHDTLDKLEFIKASVPDLYTKVIDSLYARDLYKAYELIRPFLPHTGFGQIEGEIHTGGFGKPHHPCPEQYRPSCPPYCQPHCCEPYPSHCCGSCPPNKPEPPCCEPRPPHCEPELPCCEPCPPHCEPEPPHCEPEPPSCEPCPPHCEPEPPHCEPEPPSCEPEPPCCEPEPYQPYCQPFCPPHHNHYSGRQDER